MMPTRASGGSERAKRSSRHPTLDKPVGGVAGGDGADGGKVSPRKAGCATVVMVMVPPATLTAESMLVAALASAVALEMLVCTAEETLVGVATVTASTTLPAVTVTDTSDAVTPLPAVFATAILMSLSTLVV